MRILLTNDDGIHAPGLAVLERIAASLSDDVWIVAPAEENSGAGHSLSLADPIRYRKIAERRFDSLRAEVERDPMRAEGLIGRSECAGYERRRARLIAHVEGLVGRHGEGAVLAWP